MKVRIINNALSEAIAAKGAARKRSVTTKWWTSNDEPIGSLYERRVFTCQCICMVTVSVRCRVYERERERERERARERKRVASSK